MNDLQRLARTLLETHEISLERLWLRYWANGGNASAFDLDAHLYEVKELPAFDARILSWAVEDIVFDSLS